jgi:hypothetical protein
LHCRSPTACFAILRRPAKSENHEIINQKIIVRFPEKEIFEGRAEIQIWQAEKEKELEIFAR